MDPNFQDLLKRYNEGNVSSEEKRQVEIWYLSIGKNPTSINADELSRYFSEGRDEIRQQYKTKRINPIWRNIAAAAVVFVFVAGAYLMNRSDKISNSQLVAIDSILPGEETAVFSMENGADLDLKTMVAGTKLSQGGVEIIKLATGGIKINQTGTDQVRASTIRTPKGGEFDITLPDGSTVKLNADSELKLLAGYNKDDRKVDLSGEAFFDVQKSTKPFVVSTANQKVTVLGTQFNIKAYTSELETTTKLLRGSVRVSNNGSGKEILMKPGDQVVNRGDELLVSSKEKQQVDWVNKEFIFNEKTAEELMNDIARWYNLDIEFANEDVKNKRFTGSIERYSKFTKVIAVLEATEVLNFEIEGRKIIVK